MNLASVIKILESADPAKTASPAFGVARSYRGYYEQIAFQPVDKATVGEMLRIANACIGAVFEGYKGGMYTMDEQTTCVVCEYGTTGDDDDARLFAVLSACQADDSARILRAFAERMAEHDCAYGDGCPPFSGTRHGDCLGCLARRALAKTNDHQEQP